jgi:hypothetical protein
MFHLAPSPSSLQFTLNTLIVNNIIHLEPSPRSLLKRMKNIWFANVCFMPFWAARVFGGRVLTVTRLSESSSGPEGHKTCTNQKITLGYNSHESLRYTVYFCFEGGYYVSA